MQMARVERQHRMFVFATSGNSGNVVYHFAPMAGAASREREYPAKALKIIVFFLYINYGKM